MTLSRVKAAMSHHVLSNDWIDGFAPNLYVHSLDLQYSLDHAREGVERPRAR